jgi:hypothetical protein
MTKCDGDFHFKLKRRVMIDPSRGRPKAALLASCMHRDQRSMHACIIYTCIHAKAN